VSRALIAAVASGELPLAGRLGGPVVRAIVNDRNLAQQVGDSLRANDAPLPPDFRGAIETTAREA
jgi:hypothetical protein